MDVKLIYHRVLVKPPCCLWEMSGGGFAPGYYLEGGEFDRLLLDCVRWSEDIFEILLETWTLYRERKGINRPVYHAKCTAAK